MAELRGVDSRCATRPMMLRRPAPTGHCGAISCTDERRRGAKPVKSSTFAVGRGGWPRVVPLESTAREAAVFPSMIDLRRRQWLQAACLAPLPLGLLGCGGSAARSVQVGGLPVTCNLTLPVACTA